MEYIIPLFLVFTVVFGLIKRINVFDAFTDGAKQGLFTLYSIAPTMIGLIVCVNMLKASGLTDFIVTLVKPVTDFFHFPSEILPMAVLRPVSGSGATALLTGIYKDYGADSFLGRCASVLAGSSETTFYAITMYYGSIGIKKIRHTLISALAADFTAVIMSVVTVSIFFT